jgi:hypothetical protein
MAKRLQYMDALGPTIEKAKFAAAGGDVAAEEARLMDPNYIAPGVMEQFKDEGTLQAYTPTMRENAESKIAGALESLGMSKQSARDAAIGFTGTTDSSRGGMGVGVLDFVPPFSIPTAVQEAGREVDRAQTGTDYIMPAVTVGLSAVESIPAAKLATKPLKSFISNLAAKAEPEPLIASAGPKIPRRTFVQGMAATPVAGSLSKLPLGKVDEVAKVAKAVKVALPNNFSLANLSTLKEYFDNAVDLAKAEGRADDVEVLSNMDNDQFLSEVIDNDDFLDDAVNEIKEKFPNASDDEISDLLKFGDNSMDVVKNPPQSLLNSIAEKDSGLYQDMIKNPSNYKIKSYSFLGERQYYFEASDGPFEGEVFAEGFATRKVEADEAKSWLKNLVKKRNE